MRKYQIIAQIKNLKHHILTHDKLLPDKIIIIIFLGITRNLFK